MGLSTRDDLIDRLRENMRRADDMLAEGHVDAARTVLQSALRFALFRPERF